MKLTDYNKANDLVGLQCTWCGKHTPISCLFPIMVSRPKQPHRELHNVCYGCLASNNVPKGLPIEALPWYDGKGKRVNHEKASISLAGLTVVC